LDMPDLPPVSEGLLCPSGRQVPSQQTEVTGVGLRNADRRPGATFQGGARLGGGLTVSKIRAVVSTGRHSSQPYARN
jgi:hypothetical protein